VDGCVLSRWVGGRTDESVDVCVGGRLDGSVDQWTDRGVG
jgi:hypothetical protein